MKINPENFSNYFLRISFGLLGPEQIVEINEFYQKVFESVSSQMEISQDAVRYLYNPLHQALFFKPYSPFEMVSSKMIRRKETAPWWKYNGYTGGLTSIILREHKTYLKSRIAILYPNSQTR